MRWLLLLLLGPLVLAAEVPIPGTPLALPVERGWTAITETGTVLAFTSPDRSLRVAVSDLALLPDEGPAAFSQRCLADLQRHLTDMELIDWAFDRPLGGRSWSRLRFRFRIGTQRFEQVQWLTTESGRGIIIVCGGAQGNPSLDPVISRLDADLTGSRPRIDASVP